VTGDDPTAAPAGLPHLIGRPIEELGIRGTSERSASRELHQNHGIPGIRYGARKWGVRDRIN
jgi:hypothetical protein